MPAGAAGYLILDLTETRREEEDQDRDWEQTGPAATRGGGGLPTTGVSVQEKIASMGVSPDQVEQRINSLTADELAYFNAQLDEAPAGAAGGILGVIVLFLVIFIVTDMLCATNVYKFVNCINR